MPKKISWPLKIIIILFNPLFIILIGVAYWAESISEMGFIETMKRPSVVVLFLIFTLFGYVTSLFNIKLTAKLLFIFGLVLAVLTFIVPSESGKFDPLMTPLIGIFILAPIVYWVLKRKK